MRRAWPTPALSPAALRVEARAGARRCLVGDPAQLSRRRRWRPLRSDRRAQRRNRADREPPPARPARTPRPRRTSATGEAATTSPTPPSSGRLIVADDRTEAKAQLRRRLVAGRPRRSRRQRDDRLPRDPTSPTSTPSPAPSSTQQGRLGRDRLAARRTGSSSPSANVSSAPATTAASSVANGSRGTVSPSTARNARSSSTSTTDRRVTLPGRYLDAGHVSHAYALTGHKTQGLTVERAFVLAEDAARTEGVGLRRSQSRPHRDPPLHDRGALRPRRLTAPNRARRTRRPARPGAQPTRRRNPRPRRAALQPPLVRPPAARAREPADRQATTGGRE